MSVELRKRGFSYAEILRKVPVAKSTLSLWLRDGQLSRIQQQRLTDKRRAGQLCGAQTRRRQRVERTETIVRNAQKDIEALTKREKLLIGAMLYWAEGSKEKEGNWGVGVHFSNSDHRMVRVFQKWLIEVLEVQNSDIRYEIYVHDNHAYRLSEIRKFWSQKLSISLREISRVYFKKHKVKSNRKNQGNGYYGLVRIRVRSSSTLNRKISGWIEGVIQNWGIV